MAGLVIVGAGGFGREIVDVLDSDPRAMDEQSGRPELLGFIDDGEPDLDRLDRLGVSLLGTVEDLVTSMREAHYLIGIGDSATRQQVDRRLAEAGLVASSAHHSLASCGRDIQLGEGSVLCAGSVMTTNIRAGRHLHLNLCSTIGHDCVLGDYVTISPGVNISGNTTVGSRVLFGTNSSVLPGVSIGDDAKIGAGAMVVRDVPPRTTVIGVPAKPRRLPGATGP